MRKLTTNAVAMLLALVGCMGCGNRSASSVDNLIRVDVMADYPEKELILQDLMDVEYIALGRFLFSIKTERDLGR